MKRFGFFMILSAMLMAGLTFTACSGDDITEGSIPITPTPVQPTNSYTLSVIATKSANTRTLSESNGQLIDTWNTTDIVKVYKDGVEVGTLKPDKTEATANLIGEVKSVELSKELTLKFGNSENNAEQDGTLYGIDKNYNYAEASVSVSAINGNKVTTTNANFINQYAIMKFMFSKSVRKVIISGGNQDIPVRLATATKEAYVALPVTTEELLYSFETYDENNNLLEGLSAQPLKLENGKFYTANIELKESPLTLEAIETGTITIKNPLAMDIIYVKNANEKVTANNKNITISVVSGDKVRFYGNNNTYNGNSNNSSTNIDCSADCYIYGNIMSLVNEDNYDNNTELTEEYTFLTLFRDNSHIKNHETKFLTLPATTLTNGCYSGLFMGCTGLTTAPELPATILADGCYASMFYGCTNLTTAPELPATTLADWCYQLMFFGCTGLKNAPELPATILADECYAGMFGSCSLLSKAPLLPATNLAKSCFANMFQDCISLTTTPELNVSILAEGCYQAMFYRCTGLTTAPELPATTLADRCYDSMFYGCTILTTAPELPATTLADWCYDSMFSGCTGLKNAPELPATILAGGCYRAMFHGCTGLTTAPELPATTLADRCYDSMFSDCISLTNPPELPATKLADWCYTDMFSGCTNLKYAPKLPATIMVRYCYAEMFRDCISLTNAPELPAEDLAYSCYRGMFRGCSSLNSVTCLATNIRFDSSSTTNWLKDVASVGTFIKASSMEGWKIGDSGVPEGWTIENK